MLRAIRMAARVMSQSSGDDKKLNRIAGGILASTDEIWMLPVLSDRKAWLITVIPDRLDSLRLAFARNGSHEIPASGLSNPSRVRT